ILTLLQFGGYTLVKNSKGNCNVALRTCFKALSLTYSQFLSGSSYFRRMHLRRSLVIRRHYEGVLVSC
ncbi:hypothetical protein MKX01_004572, partial [Papaver californicum]